ncbi:MAG: MqnA/MqnD/SBP family protein [Thermoplasmata archaeon]
MEPTKNIINSYHYYDPVHAYFLVYGFLSGELKSKIKINPSYEEFDTLNRTLLENKNLDVSAVSAVNFWKLADDYYLLRSGSTQRADVGAIIVSKKKYRKEEIKDLKIAIPGRSFSGYFYYRLFFNAKEEIIFRFDKIIDAVLNDEADIGLLIPGPALTSAYEKFGLKKVADVLEEWMKEANGLPMPMGSYVVNKKKFSYDEALEIRKTFQESIIYAQSHSAKAFNYALQFSKGADPAALKSFIEGCKLIYDMGETGINAIRKVYEISKKRGLIENLPDITPV